MHKLALLLPAALSTQALAAPQLVDLVSSLSGLLGGSVAQGPAPTGCSDYEVIIGAQSLALPRPNSLSISHRPFKKQNDN